MSHSYVSLDQELEVSEKSVGMYGGGVRREGKKKGKSKKMILKIPKKIVFGQRFPLYGTGFIPNIEEKITLKYYDTVNSCFEFEKSVKFPLK